MSDIVYEIEPTDVSFHVFSRVPGKTTKSYGSTQTEQEAINLASTLAKRHPDHYVYVQRQP